MVSQARRKLISVIGAGAPDEAARENAREVGRLLAERGYGVVCGGLAGVMEAACLGAAQAGGLTVGILPGPDPALANPHVQIAIPTSLGQGRNLLVVLAGLGAIAISGGAGTLSEISHALKAGKPVVGLGSWDIPGMAQAGSPQEAVDLLLAKIDKGPA